MNRKSRQIGTALGLVALLASCDGEKQGEAAGHRIKPVRAASVLIADELSGFGSLSYLRKVAVTAPNEGLVVSLPFREGDRVAAGAVIAKLDNPQLRLALGQAENALAEAGSAVELSRARLRDGEFQAEARVLALQRLEAELAGKKRELAEAERKALDQETLFAAGGLSGESIRDTRFALGTKRDELVLLERQLAVESVGLRDVDLEKAGLLVPGDAGEPGDRLAKLVRLSTGSLRAELGAVDARLEAARRSLESARLAVAELTILSPIDAVVGSREAEESERVKREDGLVTLIDVRSLYAVINLREEEALRLSKGAPARVTVDALSRCLSGTVDTVSPVADAQSASFAVRVLLQGAPTGLRPGMFARVAIRAGKARSALVIPDSALVRDVAPPVSSVGAGSASEVARTQGVVYSVSGGMVRSRNLELGPLWPEGREVVKGLEVGDVVVDHPDAKLAEGEHVEVEG